MGKGKYKRKKQHRHDPEENGSPVPLSKKINPANKAEDTTYAERQADGKKEEHHMRFSESRKRVWQTIKSISKSTITTNWLLVVFTAALAASAIYQFGIMGGQLDEMRKDQRPWMRAITQTPPIPDKSTTVSIIFGMMNTGKTPAKSVIAKLFIERVKNGEAPQLNNSEQISSVTTGIEYPNTPYSFSVSYDLLESDIEDFKAGRLFLVLYGEITYTDVFHAKHWVKFCGFTGGTPGVFTAEKCTSYNDTDND